MIELPKDAEGREIPRNTEVMYDINGKEVHITSFTYKCDVLGLWSQWKVFSPDITGEKDGMLPAESLYLTKQDSWEKLEDDLGRAADAQSFGCCAYANRKTGDCSSCPVRNNQACVQPIMRDIASRIRKLRGENDV